MPGTGAVRWGIMGTAGIARKQFLPALREAGGTAAVVAGRDLARAQEYASSQGIGRAVQGYQALIDDPGVDVIYLPLPNGLHAEWTTRALRAGKPVLCEKPLCGTLAETRAVLAVAQETGTLLWEAFVFPFQAQLGQLRSMLADGVIGELREIQANFHFRLTRPDDIRLRGGLAGGALNDVGCYPVRLAGELITAPHDSAWAVSIQGGDGVDVETQGSLGFPGGRRLLLSCGFRRAGDTFGRLLGTGGQINITAPYHPRADDTFQVCAAGKPPRSYPAAGQEQPFTAAIRHIQAVLRGEEEPRCLALDTSLRTAQALRDLRASAAAQQPPAGPGPAAAAPAGTAQA
ncbi:MAG: Gfo/Idh/MocA family protein, partial [Streptosporangiaceae bacterium]